MLIVVCGCREGTVLLEKRRTLPPTEDPAVVKECTFKPKIITKISKNYVDSLPRHEILYQRSTKNTPKDSKVENRPSINKVSKGMVNKPFFQRLQED